MSRRDRNFADSIRQPAAYWIAFFLALLVTLSLIGWGLSALARSLAADI